MDERAFVRLPRHMVMTWAAELDKPDYVLQHWQYQFLTGQDRPEGRKHKLIERLSPKSLGQVAGMHGRRVTELMDRAGVKL